MPELPEVETTRRAIAPLLQGQRLLRLEHDAPHKYHATHTAAGQRIERVSRRGKYLILELEGELDLIIHLGMTGGLRLERTPHTRLTLHLEGASPLPTQLHFHDPRRFGKVGVVRRGEYHLFPTLQAMGPEPLTDEFDEATFTRQAAQAGAVKPWLLSQKPVAGLGNIYVDEALWRSRLHPQQTRLRADEAHTLHTAIREVLGQAVEAGGSSLGNGMGNYRQHDGQAGGYQHRHAVYGKAGQPCPRCATPIERIVVAQRGTHLCPQCQVLEER